MLIYGINPVLEALRAKRVTTLRVSQRTGGRVAEVVAAAETAGVATLRVSTADLDRSSGRAHAGATRRRRGGGRVDG